MLTATRLFVFTLTIAAAMLASSPLHARGGGGHGGGGGRGGGGGFGGGSAHNPGGGHGFRGGAYGAGYGVNPNEYGPGNSFAANRNDELEDEEFATYDRYQLSAKQRHKRGGSCRRCKCWTAIPLPCEHYCYWPHFTAEQLYLVSHHPWHYIQHVRGIRYH